MRKPNALTKSIAYPGSRFAAASLHCVRPVQSSLFPSPSLPLKKAQAAKDGPVAGAAATCSSSNSASCAESGGYELAARLFHLLQLQRQSSFLNVAQTHADGTPNVRATSSPFTVRTRERFTSAAQVDDLQHQLCSEVAALGDVLQMYCRAHHGGRNSDQHYDDQKSRFNRQASSEKGASVQLLPTPSDSEGMWLLPLRRDVVQHLLRQLAQTEELHRVAALWKSEHHNHDTPLSHSQRKSYKGPAKKGNARANADAQSTSESFFHECSRVVALLAVLCDSCESDAQPLACLAHVLLSSSAAGSPVSASTLMRAVEIARRGESSGDCGSGDGTHVAGDKASTVPATAAPSSWCSCVPWLLHRFEVSHLRSSTALSEEEWTTASAWMTAAADRVCATQASELLYPFGTSRHTSVHGATPSEARAGLFGKWQRVLDEEAEEGEEDSLRGAFRDAPQLSPPTAVASAVASSMAGRQTYTNGAELQVWLADVSGPNTGSAAEGSMRPYFEAVVRELSRSGAAAVDALLRLSAAQTDNEGKRAHRWKGRHASSFSTEVKPSANVSPALLKAMQFHAIGAYVSLRRITSSLQRHRRLAPLLRLHAVVSGYQPLAQYEEGSTDRMRQCADDEAVRSRQRLLCGELFDVHPSQAGRRGQQQRRSHVEQTPSGSSADHHRTHPMLQQSAAMLWREVALLDAYTLITLGHVSEHAVDIAVLDKSAVLAQLTHLQTACIAHLKTLNSAAPQEHADSSATSTQTVYSEQSGSMAAARRDVYNASAELSPARARLLLSRLTPRTRQSLAAKLQEGLRLSAKVLARWQEPQMICALFRAYPRMGASWEVGRALLQCGEFQVAVDVLQTLLAASPTHNGASAALLTSNAAVVRQLLLEAMQGAAAALVAQQYHHTAPPMPAASSPLDAPPYQSDVSDASGTTPKPTDASAEVEAPLPAELRAQLHSLYTHTTALPVPLPLCLNAVLQGLTYASAANASATSLSAQLRFKTEAPTLFLANTGGAQLQTDAFTATQVIAVSAEEHLRRTAVLCTYILRCHLAEHPSEGLLSASVELWASSVAPYLCRPPRTAAPSSSTWSAGPMPLSMADRYIREVAVRLLHGYPHLPVGRLLLTRVLLYCQPTLPAAAAIDASVKPRAQPDRATATVLWLLHTLFRYAGSSALGESSDRVAYPVCAPTVAFPNATPRTPVACWNADFTERYTQDTLRLMPRIALERLSILLDADTVTERWRGGRGSTRYLKERVDVALRFRQRQDDAQHQPWQCTTCYLWNSRYASECKRCHTLASSLLQCRTCGYFTSSAMYQATDGLACDVCGSELVAPARATLTAETSASSLAGHDRADTAAVSDEQKRVSEKTALFPTSDTPQGGGMTNTSVLPSPTTAAATVTGSGRPASLFKESTSVLRVVALRPWTCSHCRTPNEAQHVFFCRACGRPPAAEAGHVVAALGSGDGVCGDCGHAPSTVEGRLLPWCERCGALQEQLRHVLSMPPAETQIPSACGRETSIHKSTDVEGHTRRMRRRPSLWWCSACAVTLNPWTRTHCSLCGSGRPVEALEASRPASAGVAITNAEDVAEARAAWSHNASAPFIQVPWSMQSCGACEALNRVGAGQCWKCGTALVWPEAVQSAIAARWRHWLTQVTHTVTAKVEQDTSDGAKTVSVATRGSTPERVASSTGEDTVLSQAPVAGVPLLLPRTQRWVCLHDGCLHMNSADVPHTVDATPLTAMVPPVCCAACHAPRDRAEIFNPFRDRLGWHSSSQSDDTARAPGEEVVKALCLPEEDPPHPMQQLIARLNDQRTDAAKEKEPRATSLHMQVVHASPDMPPPACAHCGATSGATYGNSASPPANSLDIQSLFLIKVCPACGHCAWERSCGAYEPTVDSAATSSSFPERGLLAGEEALALRLLLRSLSHTVQRAVSLHTAKSPAGKALVGDGADTRAASLPLDWALFSRHVHSAVQLLRRGSQHQAGASANTNAHGGGCDEGSGAGAPERVTHDTLLPWRGCDVATPDQLCSAEPRTAVLSDVDATVHSALLEVRQVLEGICFLVEQRTAAAPPSTAAPQSNRGRKSSAVRKRRKSSSRARLSFSSSSPSSSPSSLCASRTPGGGVASMPTCLQDAWTRRLLCAALDLIDVVNDSTVFDEIGFATLSRLCHLLRPHEDDHIQTETKWAYLQEMKLSRCAIVHGCVACERCLTNHAPSQPCAAV